MTESEAALIVSQRRPDLCRLIPGWSNNLYNCSTPANAILLVTHWWNAMSPPEKGQYGTLVAYVTAMGWTSGGTTTPPPGGTTGGSEFGAVTGFMTEHPIITLALVGIGLFMLLGRPKHVGFENK
ncbi:MAG: hypothetical protein Q8R92_16680 [Deltaproteobacteria bacterium]|nr:hypothetical protein [Deltaproteobacteria bacterium]